MTDPAPDPGALALVAATPEGLRRAREGVRRLAARCPDARRGAELASALNDAVLRLQLALVLDDREAVAAGRRDCARLLGDLGAGGRPRDARAAPAVGPGLRPGNAPCHEEEQP